MMTSANRIAVCTAIESGTVYHFLEPTLIDGSTMSPNMSRATGSLLETYALLAELYRRPAKGGDYSHLKIGESTNLPGNLDTRSRRSALAAFLSKTRPTRAI